MVNRHMSKVLRFKSSLYDEIERPFADRKGSLIDSDFFILINESDVSKNGEFVRFINMYRPKLILDLRISPRLDFVAGSRQKTFQMFDRYSIQYVDVFGRLGVYSREEFFSLKNTDSDFLPSSVIDDEGGFGPIVFLFDDKNILNRCQVFFRRDIKMYMQEKSRPNVSRFRCGFLSF